VGPDFPPGLVVEKVFGVVVGIFLSVISRIIKTESLDFSLVNHDTKHIPNLIQVNSTRLTPQRVKFQMGDQILLCGRPVGE
jgi:hypothetical protein